MKKLFCCVLLPAIFHAASAQNAKIQWPLRSNDAAPAGQEIAAQAPASRAILDGWQTQNSVRGERFIRLVYWVPQGREPLPQSRERLSKIMLDIQAFFAREMERNGFGPRTFGLKKDADGLLELFMAQGSKTRDKYGRQSGNDLRKDAAVALQKAGIDSDKETILIFANLVDWDENARTMGGDFPYNGEGTTRRGSAVQLDSAVLFLDGLLDVSDAAKVRNNEYGFITLGRYNSIFIGGIAHELGHALSLPHNKERPDQEAWGKSLMGSGNRTYGDELRTVEVHESKGKGSFLTFADALRLASHPSFCGSIKGFDGEANAQLSDVKYVTDGKSITYSARVTANPPVYGVIGYFDPAGGSDYDATTATAIPDKDGRFTLESSALSKGIRGVLRVVALQANGAASSWNSAEAEKQKYPYAVAPDGTVNLDSWNTQQQLAPLAAAVLSEKRDAVEAARQTLQAQNAPAHLLEIAQVQLANFEETTKTSPAETKSATLFLSDAKPREARVGWLKPTYNRLPFEDNNPLLIADGQFYARGIYAHAPAHHVYDLDGQWHRLSGRAGVAEGKDGSVVFVVIGDGKELWRSKLLREGETAPFDLVVKDAKTLEMRVEDGGNTASSDWGLWLNPTLTR